MKVYKKPVIYIESFQLMEHIASICDLGDGVQVNTRENTACYYIDNGIVLYAADDVCGGTYDEAMDGSWEEYYASVVSGTYGTCYNAFGGTKAFHS